MGETATDFALPALGGAGSGRAGRPGRRPRNRQAGPIGAGQETGTRLVKVGRAARSSSAGDAYGLLGERAVRRVVRAVPGHHVWAAVPRVGRRNVVPGVYRRRGVSAGDG